MSDGVRATKGRPTHVIAHCTLCDFEEEAWSERIPAARGRVRRHVQQTGHTVFVINEATTTYGTIR